MNVNVGISKQKDLFRKLKLNSLYPLLFQEYIYSLAHDRRLKIFVEPLQILGDKNENKYRYSLVLVKHLIIQMSHHNSAIFSINDSNQNVFGGHNNFFYYDFSYQMLSDGFGIILEIPFLFLSSPEKKKKKPHKFHKLRSIHSIFTFLEDKLSYLNYVSDLLIPYPIHLEILFKILQCWIKDVLSLHLLQLFFNEHHKNKSIYVLSKINKRLFLFLHNLYIYEYEFIFLFIHQKYSYLRSTSFGMFIEQTHFYIKVERVMLILVRCYFFRGSLCKDPFMHYVRYKGGALMASRGTFMLVNKWKYYLIKFWQSYFHFWSQPYRIYINKLSDYSLSCLGYLSSVLKNNLPVKNQMIKSLFIIKTLIKKLDTAVPATSLIRSLSEAQFCTLLGHPISKPTWSNVSDYDIINVFCQICRNLCCYHSGSSKKRVLYRIKYILQLSCARTLAHKHKNKVRALMRRLEFVFLEEFFMKEEQIIYLILLQKQKKVLTLYRSHRVERIWSLDIIFMNDILS
uniref:Maturase K n=1 Tax=Lecanorchis kiusiana TaxID=915453 RepID=A0A6G7KVG9_9ASPA|nr:maturase K [Lecanorchis kiusiana]QII89381.1 maturase K [Lecanorchis kiusiana]